ncbi:hypothetical protein ACFFWC_04500 [Plantactinospora siamensis]|uniref:Exo-alpha-sialidase n=1 Tax=Plantactinospora siamensis TaxID=555372 RepID=A0ABV6NR80_9ACTN
MRVRFRSAAALAAVLLLAPAGCGIGDVRRTPARPSAPASARPSLDEPWPVRTARVPVPADYPSWTVRFTDAETGYVLFSRCYATSLGAEPGGTPPPPECPGVLLRTLDGGRHWTSLPLPRATAANFQLFARDDRLVLVAEPHGWYASTDRGSTFSHPSARTDPPPAAYFMVQGRFQVCCDRDRRPPAVLEWAADRARPLARQPDVPGLAEVAYANGRLVATGVRDGRPYAAISPDDGRTWRSTPVPAPGGRLGRLEPQVDGGDAWLVGWPADNRQFPTLWRLVGDAWRPESAAGHPDLAYAVTAIGDGVLAVQGSAGAGVVVAGRYRRAAWPAVGDLTLLADGALCVVTEAYPRTIWLGRGAGVDRRWVRLELVTE